MQMPASSRLQPTRSTTSRFLGLKFVAMMKRNYFSNSSSKYSSNSSNSALSCQQHFTSRASNLSSSRPWPSNKSLLVKLYNPSNSTSICNNHNIISNIRNPISHNTSRRYLTVKLSQVIILKIRHTSSSRRFSLSSKTWLFQAVTRISRCSGVFPTTTSSKIALEWHLVYLQKIFRTIICS